MASGKEPFSKGNFTKEDFDLATTLNSFLKKIAWRPSGPGAFKGPIALSAFHTSSSPIGREKLSDLSSTLIDIDFWNQEGYRRQAYTASERRQYLCWEASFSRYKIYPSDFTNRSCECVPSFKYDWFGGIFPFPFSLLTRSELHFLIPTENLSPRKLLLVFLWLFIVRKWEVNLFRIQKVLGTESFWLKIWDHQEEYQDPIPNQERRKPRNRKKNQKHLRDQPSFTGELISPYFSHWSKELSSHMKVNSSFLLYRRRDQIWDVRCSAWGAVGDPTKLFYFTGWSAEKESRVVPVPYLTDLPVLTDLRSSPSSSVSSRELSRLGVNMWKEESSHKIRRSVWLSLILMI